MMINFVNIRFGALVTDITTRYSAYLSRIISIIGYFQ